MDLRFLTTFIEVSKTKHFGKAAENLYLTPAAVSSRIKQLEEYFNATLFTRVRNGIHLTAAGEKLLPYAQNMLDSLKDARSVIAEQETSLIVCGASPNAGALILEHVISTLQNGFEHIAIKAEVHCGEQLSRQLQERTIDFAFTTEPLKSSDIETIQLQSYPLKLYALSNDLIDTDSQAFIQIDWSARLIEQAYSRYPQFRQYKFRTNSVQSGIDFANQHGGCLFLPEKLANKLNAAMHVQAIELEAVGCFLAFRKDERMSEKNTLIEHLVEVLSADS